MFNSVSTKSKQMLSFGKATKKPTLINKFMRSKGILLSNELHQAKKKNKRKKIINKA